MGVNLDITRVKRDTTTCVNLENTMLMKEASQGYVWYDSTYMKCLESANP